AGNEVFGFGDGKSVDGHIAGGGGSNTLNFAAYTTAINVNLQAGTANAGALGGLDNIQNLIGGTGDDTIVGSAAGGFLLGGNGSDTITAGAGRSVVAGGAGNDSLTAGANGAILLPGAARFEPQHS